MALYTKRTSHKIIPPEKTVFPVPPIPTNGKREPLSLAAVEQVYCYWCVIQTRCSRLQRASPRTNGYPRIEENKGKISSIESPKVCHFILGGVIYVPERKNNQHAHLFVSPSRFVTQGIDDSRIYSRALIFFFLKTL